MEIDRIKYYVYAFDIKKRLITAALSCPDEKTAKEIYSTVSRKMEVEYGTKGFHFRYARVRDASQLDSELLLLDGLEVYIITCRHQ